MILSICEKDENGVNPPHAYCEALRVYRRREAGEVVVENGFDAVSFQASDNLRFYLMDDGGDTVDSWHGWVPVVHGPEVSE